MFISDMHPLIINPASSDHTARLWEMASGETVRQYNGHHKGINLLQDRAFRILLDQTRTDFFSQLPYVVPCMMVQVDSSLFRMVDYGEEGETQ